VARGIVGLQIIQASRRTRYQSCMTVLAFPLLAKVASIADTCSARIPLFMWWYQVGPIDAVMMEIALLVFFLVFTFVFTWIFDRLVPIRRGS